jgi:hypothetical protein
LTQDAAMDGTDPATNAAAYTVLPRATADMGYITEYDPIEYDWANDWLQYREDKRGNKYRYDYTTDVSNKVYGSSAIPLFQWGNDFVFGNIAQNSFLNIVNSFPSSVYFFNNELETGSLFYNNTFAANCSFFLNFLRASCDFHNNTFAANCNLIYNTIGFGCIFCNNVFGAASIFSYNEIEFSFDTNTTNASVVVARNIFHIATNGITYSANYDDNTLLPGIVNIPSGSTYNIDGSPHAHDVDEVVIPGGMGTPTYDDLQDFLNMTQSSGRLTGGALTAHTDGGADGTLDIAEMEGMVHTANTLGSPLIYFKKAAVGSIALTDLAVNYIIVTYTEPGGTPTLTYSASATRPAANTYNAFVVGRCWRSGNDVEVLTTGQNIYDIYGRQQDRLLAKYGTMDHASGSTLSAHATALRMTCDAGVWFFGNTRIDTGAVSTFHVWYKTGGGAWTESGPFTLFSEVFDGGTSKVYETYQNGTSLGALGANAYGVYWIFECPEGDLYVVLGTASHSNIGSAQTSTIPASLPPYCQYWGKLIGRVIVKKTAAAFYSVESVWTTSFALTAGTYVPTDRVITTTAPLTIEGGASADLSADRTIAITAATTDAAGSMSAADKTKLDGLSAGSWTTVRKTADESKASDTTLGADTHLRFTAVASKTYAVRGRVWFSTPAAADFKFRFTFTSGASIFIHHVSIPCGSATETVGMENATPTTTISCLGTGTTGGYVEFDGVVTADASNRTFALQWAQVTSNAGNTTVKAGSYVEHLLVD